MRTYVRTYVSMYICMCVCVCVCVYVCMYLKRAHTAEYASTVYASLTIFKVLIK